MLLKEECLEDLYIWFLRKVLARCGEIPNDLLFDVSNTFALGVNSNSMYRGLERIANCYGQLKPTPDFRQHKEKEMRDFMEGARKTLAQRVFDLMNACHRPPISVLVALREPARASFLGEGLNDCAPAVAAVLTNSDMLWEISGFISLHHLEATCRPVKNASTGVVMYTLSQKYVEPFAMDPRFREKIFSRVQNMQKQLRIHVDLTLPFAFLEPVTLGRLQNGVATSAVANVEFISSYYRQMSRLGSLVVEIASNDYEFDGRWLYRFPMLSSLVLNVEVVNARNLKVINTKFFSHLKSLVIKSDKLGLNLVLAASRKMPFASLTDLRLVPLPCKSLDAFGPLPELVHLELGRGILNSIEFVKHCPKLRTLVIDEVRVVRSLKPLERVKTLKTLRISEQQLASLPRLRSVHSLDIRGFTARPIRSLAFSVLRGFTSLQRLVMDECNFEDVGYLVELTELRYLSVNKTMVADIRPIRALKQLEFLAIGGLKIPHGLHWRNFPKSLMRLVVSVNDQTRRELDAVKKYRPDIQVCEFPC